MRFLRKDKAKKTIIVISDLHLGAGVMVDGQRNYLEDFHSDKELVDFLKYYSKGIYLNREVELIINGDFVDLLAVPYVDYFDDEYWSEEASLLKLKKCIAAHLEVFSAMNKFLTGKDKKIIYILGNHDAELNFPSLQNYLLEQFTKKNRERFIIKSNEQEPYRPYPGIVLMHGHEYERAHNYKAADVIVKTEEGKSFFIPPWGSYYVTRVINKFKEERDHINAVRPIKKFLIYGLIYDTLFTIRFLFSNIFYFLMVRFLDVYRKGGKNIKKIFADAASELELFKDFEDLTSDYLLKNPQIRALIVGHTHEPMIRSNAFGNYFINTGTWTKMYNLDFGKSNSDSALLTYAKINIYGHKKKDHLELALNIWKGTNTLPFQEF